MHILFVCTGNICRSPMAEGIARERYPDLATFSSAGTRAVRGSAPTGFATTVTKELGIDIAGLRASSLRKAITPTPDHIYVMTERHRSRVVADHPGLAGRVELLDPSGDVADPYGLDADFYRATRDKIAAAIDYRARHWRQEQSGLGNEESGTA
jgi:protein-tyrosine phosphatase